MKQFKMCYIISQNSKMLYSGANIYDTEEELFSIVHQVVSLNNAAKGHLMLTIDKLVDVEREYE